MVNYSNSKIYKIVNNNCEDGNVYFGSTVQPLHKRLYQHKKKYESWKAGKFPFITSFKLYDQDYENVKIILVEELECENKQQLIKRERYYIENNKCVNKNIPTRTNKEYREDNKDKYKEYYNKNKEELLKKRKEWRDDNKEYMKEYRNKNKEELLKKKKEYYNKIKEALSKKRKIKIECPFCKKSITKNNLKRHQKTIKCLTFQLTK